MDLYSGNKSDIKKIKCDLFEIIGKTEEVESKVRFVSSDMGPDNQSLWNELGVTEDEPYFLNPVENSRKIYVFADVQHVFKNITQTFARHDGILIPEDIRLKHDLPTNKATINHVKDLFHFEEESIFKLTPKLKQFMFEANGFQKMRLKNSYYLMSWEVASALRLLASTDSSKDSFKTTAWFIKKVAYWHKIMTSRSFDLAFSECDPQKHTETMEFLEEIVAIFTELLKEGFKFILTSRFSTDAVENLFSVIRLSNCKPDAVQIKNILR